MRTSPLSSDMTFPVNHKGDKGARLSKACPRLTKEDYWPHPERAEACFIIKPWKRYFLHRWKAVWQYRGNFLVNEQVFLWILAWNRSRRHETWAGPFLCCCVWGGRRRAWSVCCSKICVGPCVPFRSGKSRSSSIRCWWVRSQLRAAGNVGPARISRAIRNANERQSPVHQAAAGCIKLLPGLPVPEAGM